MPPNRVVALKNCDGLDRARAGRILGDFGDTAYQHDGVTYRFRRQDGQFVIEATERDGPTSRCNVAGVAGIAGRVVRIEK